MSAMDPDTQEATYFGLECSAVEMVRRIGEMKGLQDPTDGEAVFAFINQQDEEATAIFNAYCMKVAVQIMNLQYILDPELFAIGVASVCSLYCWSDCNGRLPRLSGSIRSIRLTRRSQPVHSEMMRICMGHCITFSWSRTNLFAV